MEKPNLRKILFLIFILLTLSERTHSQGKNKFTEWSTWTIIQAVPSFVFTEESNNENSRLQFGLKWNIVPLNYSFNANQLVSPVQFFKVNPVRRLSGSIEAFLQPEWALSGFKYSDLKRFSLSAGTRIYFPVAEYGEYLALSLGGKYRIRSTNSGIRKNIYAIELTAYSFFGILGMQFNYNFDDESKYDFGINLKYY